MGVSVVTSSTSPVVAFTEIASLFAVQGGEMSANLVSFLFSCSSSLLLSVPPEVFAGALACAADCDADDSSEVHYGWLRLVNRTAVFKRRRRNYQSQLRDIFISYGSGFDKLFFWPGLRLSDPVDYFGRVIMKNTSIKTNLTAPRRPQTEQRLTIQREFSNIAPKIKLQHLN